MGHACSVLKWENSGLASTVHSGVWLVFWCPDFPRDEREGVSGGRRRAEDRRLTLRDMWNEIKLLRYFPAAASYVPSGRQNGQRDSVRAIVEGAKIYGACGPVPGAGLKLQ